MLPREFYRRLRFHSERLEQEQDAAWNRTLFLVNTVRGLVKKAKPITLESLKRPHKEAPSKEEFQRDIERLGL